MGKLQTQSADTGEDRVFTTEQRGARGKRCTSRSRFRRWARRDHVLYQRLEDARRYGTETQQVKAQRAWAEHQLSMPVRGRND